MQRGEGGHPVRSPRPLREEVYEHTRRRRPSLGHQKFTVPLGDGEDPRVDLASLVLVAAALVL